MSILEAKLINCPYCGVELDISVETYYRGQEYIEDCQVCCCPILIRFDIDADTQVINLQAQTSS